MQKRIGLLLLCMLVLISCGAAAEENPAKEIEPGGTIFVYEEHLNLKALRNPQTDNPITSLRLYVNENPANALLLEIPVDDDTDFTADHILLEMEENLGVYYTYNPEDGPIARLKIDKQELILGITLASPDQGENVEGLWLPKTTSVTFEITSPRVGTLYYDRAGDVDPPRISIVIVDEEGREIYDVGACDLRNIVIDSPHFYTDDPGKPGPISLHLLGEGTYSAQAIWVNPDDFADAPDSRKIHFIVGEKVGIEVTPTPTLTPAPTRTPVPTTPTTTSTGTPLPTATATAGPVVTETPPEELNLSGIYTTRPTTVPTPATGDDLARIPGPLLFFGIIGAFVVVSVIKILGGSREGKKKN